MKNILLFAISILFAVGVYSQQQYTSPQTLYVKGDHFQCYDEAGLKVFATAEIRSAPSGLGREFRVNMVVINGSDQTIEVNTGDFRAYTFKGKKNEVKELKVFSSKDYEKSASNNLIWFGPGNSQNVSATTTVKDQHGNRVMEAETSGRVYTGELKDLLSETAKTIRKNYLSRNTLTSGNTQTGFFIVENIKKGSVFLEANLGGNSYLFVFDMEELL